MRCVPQRIWGGVTIKADIRLEKVETAFFQGLIELQYGQSVEKKLRSLAQQIPWARGWPTKKQAFWNAEAFMWQRKIDKQQRQLITQEIEREIKQEVAILAGRSPGKRNPGLRNLDLGCGAHNYLHSAAGVDLSAKMLAFNEQIGQKVLLDLEKLGPPRHGLPFPGTSFDSVTAVFLLNYLPNHAHTALFREIQRVLKKSGLFMMVLAAQSLEHRYGQQERAKLSFGQWKQRLRPFFQVKAYEKEKILFFCCRK